MAAVLAEDQTLLRAVAWWAVALKTLEGMRQLSFVFVGQAVHGSLLNRTDPVAWGKIGDQLGDLIATFHDASIRYGAVVPGDPLESPFEEVARS
jgi:hypothetical protein